MVPHWVRGGTDQAQALTAEGKRKLDVVALGNSIGTGKQGLKSEVLMVQSFEELDAKKDQVAGKIVYFNYPFNNTMVRTFEAYGDASKYRGQGPSRAAKYGAVGVIVRSMSHSTDNHPHTGATRYDSLYNKIPAVAIGLQDANWLAERIASSPVQVSMKTLGTFLPDVEGHNVIGELKGG